MASPPALRAHAGRYLVLRVRLDDRPGQLAALLQPLADMRVNVIDIEHRRAGWLLPVDQSDVLLHLETRDADHAREIIAALREAAYDDEPLTDVSPKSALRCHPQSRL